MAIFTAISVAVGALVSSFTAGITAASISTFLTRTIARVLVNALVSAILGKGEKTGYSLQGQLQAGEAVPRSFPLGRTLVRGSLVYANSFTYTGSPENGWMAWVIALSDLPIPGTPVRRMMVNGSYVTIDYANESVFGYPVTEYQGGFTGAEGYMFVRFYDGTQTAADPFLVSTFSADPLDERKYGTDRIGTGIAYAVIIAHVNQELFSGWPRFAFELNGVPLYDPSKDTSVGGSGTQRWGTPSTWGGDGDDFPVVQAYNLMRGITYGGQWLYGFQNIGDGQLPVSSWISGIGKCRLAVDTHEVGVQEPQYRSGVEVTVDIEVGNGLEQILAACAGRIAEAGGIYKPAVGVSSSPVMSFTDDDIVSTEDQDFTPFLGLEDTINGLTASYPEPEEGYAIKQAPPIYVPEYEVLDGNRRLTASVDLPNVPYAEQVQRLLQSSLAEARRFRRHTHVMPPEYSLLEPNDVLEWTSPTHGYVSKRFRVDGAVRLPNCNVVLDITEVDPTDYDWDPATDWRPVTPRPINPVSPGPVSVGGFAVQGISITDASGTGRRPAIQITWTVNALLTQVMQAIRWQVRVKVTQAMVVRQSSRDVDESGGVIVSEGILPATEYEVRVKFVAEGRQASWTSWASVTTPDVRLGTGDIETDIIDDIATATTTATNAAAAAATVANDLTSATAALSGQISTALTDATALASLLQGVLSDPYLSVDDPNQWVNTPSEGTLTKSANAVYSQGQTWRLQSTGTQEMGLLVESDRTIWVGDPALSSMVVEVEFTPNSTTDLTAAGIRAVWVYDGATNFRTDLVKLADVIASPAQVGRQAIARAVLVHPDTTPSPGVLDYVRVYFDTSSNDYGEAQHDQDISAHRMFIRAALPEEAASGRVSAAIDSAIQTLTAAIEAHTGQTLSSSLSDSFYTIVAGDTAIALAVQTLQAAIEDPGGASLGATVETNRLAQVSGDGALAAQLDVLEASMQTDTVVWVPSPSSPDYSEDFFTDSAIGDPLVASNFSVSGWEILQSNGRLRCNAVPATGGSSTANVFAAPIIPVNEGEIMRAEVTMFVAQGSGATATAGLGFRFVWLDASFNEISSDYSFVDVPTSNSGGYSAKFESTIETAVSGAEYCRVGFYLRPQFSAPVPSQVTFRHFKAYNDTTAQVLSGQITDILAVDINALTGTALATMLTDLGVTGGGNAATVTQLGTAVADLEGNAAALVAFRAQAGSSNTLLELVAADNASGAVSAARIAASNILLQGSVVADSLAIISGTYNAIMDPSTVMGDFRNWSNVPSGWEVVQGNPGSATSAVKTAPSTYIVKMPQNGSNQVALVQVLRDPGPAGTKWTYGFMYATGGGTRSSTFRLRVVYKKSDGTYIGEHVETLANQANTSWRVWPDYAGDYGAADGSATGKDAVPADCGYIEVYFGRNGGGSGDAYMTDLRAFRQARGGTIIEDGTITTNEINTTEFAASGLAVFGGDLQSTDFVSGSAGWRIRNGGNAEFNQLIVRNSLVPGSVSDVDLDEAITGYDSTLASAGQETIDTFVLDNIDSAFATDVTISLEARSRPLGATGSFRVVIQREFQASSASDPWETMDGELTVKDSQSTSNTYVPFTYSIREFGEYYAIRYSLIYVHTGGNIVGDRVARRIYAKSNRVVR